MNLLLCRRWRIDAYKHMLATLSLSKEACLLVCYPLSVFHILCVSLLQKKVARLVRLAMNQSNSGRRQESVSVHCTDDILSLRLVLRTLAQDCRDGVHQKNGDDCQSLKSLRCHDFSHMRNEFWFVLCAFYVHLGAMASCQITPPQEFTHQRKSASCVQGVSRYLLVQHCNDIIDQNSEPRPLFGYSHTIAPLSSKVTMLSDSIKKLEKGLVTS